MASKPHTIESHLESIIESSVMSENTQCCLTEVFEIIRTIVKKTQLLNQGGPCRVIPIGSSASGLGTEESDLDISLLLHSVETIIRCTNNEPVSNDQPSEKNVQNVKSIEEEYGLKHGDLDVVRIATELPDRQRWFRKCLDALYLSVRSWERQQARIRQGGKAGHAGCICSGKHSCECGVHAHAHITTGETGVWSLVKRPETHVSKYVWLLKLTFVKYVADPFIGISRILVPVDISLANVLPVYNTPLIRAYMECDKRAWQVCMLVKLWGKKHFQYCTPQHKLSSYALVLLVIHFLQHYRPMENAVIRCWRLPPLLPNLQNPSIPLQRRDYQAVDVCQFNGVFKSRRNVWFCRNNPNFDDVSHIGRGPQFKSHEAKSCLLQQTKQEYKPINQPFSLLNLLCCFFTFFRNDGTVGEPVTIHRRIDAQVTYQSSTYENIRDPFDPFKQMGQSSLCFHTFPSTLPCPAPLLSPALGELLDTSCQWCVCVCRFLCVCVFRKNEFFWKAFC